MPRPTDLGCGRPARVVFRKTGETPVPPGLRRPSYSRHTPANARVQGLGAIFTAFRLDRRSDPTPGPKDKVPRRWALGMKPRPRWQPTQLSPVEPVEPPPPPPKPDGTGGGPPPPPPPPPPAPPTPDIKPGKAPAMAESICGAIAGFPRLAASPITFAISCSEGSPLEPSGSTACLPSSAPTRLQRPVPAAACKPFTAISGAASGLFFTAAKTASAICSGVALFQLTPGGKALS